MTNLFKKSLYTTAFVVAAISSNYASAQTSPIVVTAEVLNSLTLATAQELNFGTFAITGDGASTADIIISTAGVVSAANSGGAATSAVVDDAAATAAQITIADGADGATLNITIDVTADPTDGTHTLDFNAFSASYNGAAPSIEADGVAFTETFDAAFGGGTNTLDVGATLRSQLAVGLYNDGTYTGGLDVTFSY